MQDHKDTHKQTDIQKQNYVQDETKTSSNDTTVQTSNTSEMTIQLQDQNKQNQDEQTENEQDKDTYVVPRYLQKALYMRSKALHENFRDYGMPQSLQDNLRALDNTQDALSKGSRYEDPNAPKEYLEALHKKEQHLDEEEDEIMQSHLYKKAKSHMQIAQEQEQSLKDKIAKNFKIVLVVIVGLIGYYLYGNYIREIPNELDELKQALPLKIDKYTTIEKIEENDKNLTMYIVKSNELYNGASAQEIQERLNNVAHSAQNMCKIPIIYSMIESGKTLTVLLSTQDNAYKSSITIDKCNKN